MESDKIIYEVIYCPEDVEYRVYCDICDNFCLKQYYKNHLKSQTYISNIRKKQHFR